MTSRRSLALLIPAVAAALALSGCSAPTSAADDGKLMIVASTSVYGDVARQIAGENATITSLIDSSVQDPHSYEASAQDRLAVSKADIVIENGGGYDPFVDTLTDAAADDELDTLDVSEISGLLPDDDGHDDDAGADDDAHAESEEEHDHVEGFNEHLWYNVEVVGFLALELERSLSGLDPENASDYQANSEAFMRKLDVIRDTAAELKSTLGGTGVAITEPVPLYLLESVGLVNKTPEAFSEAIEEGTDVSPADLDDTIGLFASGEAKLLAYNEQTSGRETEQVKSAAEAASVPVVSFAETLPEGMDYIGWMTGNLDAIAEALG